MLGGRVWHVKDTLMDRVRAVMTWRCREATVKLVVEVRSTAVVGRRKVATTAIVKQS